MSLTHAGAFEGIGGFPLAAERVGMNLVWSAENDKHASRVLDYHWPDVPNLGDVHGIGDAPGVDVLTGGFPCQDYSVAGRGAGLAGDRGALWWQFHRIIAGVRPSWVVGENVDGLTNRSHRASLRTIIGSLVQLGYGVVWRVFDAQYFGVAQRRKRVFIVGHSGGQPRPEILALSQGVSGDSAPSRETGQRVAPTLEAGANRTGGTRPPGTTVDTAESLQVVSALTANGLGGGGPDDNLAQAGHVVSFRTNQTGAQGPIHSEYVTDTLAQDHPPAVAIETGKGWWRESDHAGPLRARDYKDVAAAVMERGSVRRLTPLECERLQGFPDGWTDIPGNSDSQRYRQLGNAVAVPVAEWILRNLARVSGEGE